MLAVGGLEVVLREVRVDLGGLHLHVSQDLLYDPEVGASLNHVRGEGVTQRVGRDSAREARLEGVLSQERIHDLSTKLPASSADEEELCRLRAHEAWTLLLDVL